MKRQIILLLTILILTCIPAFAEEAPAAGSLPEGLCLAVPAADGETFVRPQEIGGENWLFLPAFADLSALQLRSDAEGLQLTYGEAAVPADNDGTTDLTQLYPEEPADGVYRVGVFWDGGFSYLNLMHSESVTALFLDSADPEKDRKWVEASPDKSHKAKGMLTMMDAEGTLQYRGDLKQIKGRGNSTWREPKKPYQLKLKEAADLMGTGDPAEASVTWLLLTNYSDETLLANRVMFALAADLGLDYTPHCRPVDLYYDGEYRGSYLLSEKTEVGEGRVEVRDLEEAIEKANPDVEDMDELPTAIDVNKLNNEFQYVQGLKAPKDITGGYLLEVDYEDRAREEKSWFSTSDGYYLTVKSPEYAPKTAVEYISQEFQKLENAIDNGGTDPETGKALPEIADITSLAAFFLVEEISYDTDAYVSSCYLYKPEGKSLFYAGPVWDFDAVMGRGDMEIDYRTFFAGNTSIGHRLLQLPQFREEVQRLYEEKFDPLMGYLLEGEETAAADQLRSLTEYRQEMAASERMKSVLWPGIWENEKQSYGSGVADWGNRMKEHNDWLRQEMADWDENTEIPYYFWDVSPEDWYADAFTFVYERKLMNGISEFLFGPEKPITRAMVVTILHRIAGQPRPQEANAYSDVPENVWYTAAVNWASEQGLTAGYPDGTFQPDRKITREEFAVMLYRYEQLTAETGPVSEDALSAFKDKNKIGSWAVEATAWSVENGILNGTGKGLLEPRSNTKRCQAAAMIQRYLTREPADPA